MYLQRHHVAATEKTEDWKYCKARKDKTKQNIKKNNLLIGKYVLFIRSIFF